MRREGEMFIDTLKFLERVDLLGDAVSRKLRSKAGKFV